MRIWKLFAVLLMVLMSLVSQAQHGKYYYHNDKLVLLGLKLGGGVYSGDVLNQNLSGSGLVPLQPERTRLSVSGFLQKRVRNQWSLRGMFSYIGLAGDDNVYGWQQNLSYKQRNLHFKNDVFELSGMVVYDIFATRESAVNIKTFKERFIPYVATGLGVIYHSPKALDSEGIDWVSLKPLQTEGISYSNIALTIPLGLGFRYRITPLFAIGGEVVGRVTSTDYLDDVSGTYVSVNEMASSEALEFAFRGDAPIEHMTGKSRLNKPYFQEKNYENDVVGTSRGNAIPLDLFMSFSINATFYIDGAYRKPFYKRRN